MDEITKGMLEKIMKLDKEYKIKEEELVQLNLLYTSEMEKKTKLEEEIRVLKKEISELKNRKENIESELCEREKNVLAMKNSYKDLLQKASKQIEKHEEEVILNVGGTLFYTTKSTLTSQKNMFYAMFSSENFKPNKRGEYFIDRNPKYFDIILDYLRGIEDEEKWSQISSKKYFIMELDFYQIKVEENKLGFKYLKSYLNNLGNDEEQEIISPKKEEPFGEMSTFGELIDEY